MRNYKKKKNSICFGFFTSAKCLIFSASSAGIIAWDIEKATPPIKITMEREIMKFFKISNFNL